MKARWKQKRWGTSELLGRGGIGEQWKKDCGGCVSGCVRVTARWREWVRPTMRNVLSLCSQQDHRAHDAIAGRVCSRSEKQSTSEEKHWSG